ncbi:MAG: DUF4214 domain-containing protein [Paracoccaceae bacterium]
MPLPANGPGLPVYARMALDAYDLRLRANDPAAPLPADPDVSARFPAWERRPTDAASEARDSDLSEDSGLDANVYLNDRDGQVVVAFRGTEFAFFRDALDDNDLDLLDEANLTNDLLTLFGYYQDDGETIAAFVEAQGGVEAFLQETLGFGDDEADDVDDLFRVIDNVPFFGGIERIGRIGENRMRDQAEGAIRAVLEAAADNPGRAVTVTGHSLGGALAAYASAALGVPGVLFDPAPWGATDFLDELRAFADGLLADEFSGLDTAALGWDRSRPPAETAVGQTATYRVADSFVPDLYLAADPRDLPGALDETVIELANTSDVDPLLLHSVSLHALAADSAAREGRVAFADLTEATPRLMERLDALDVPGEADVEALLTGLVVSDPAYALLEDLVGRTAEEVADYAPEGSGEDGAAVEAALLDRALGQLAGALATDRLDVPGSVAGVFGDGTGTGRADVLVGAFAETETVRPGLGDDVIATGAGARDVVAGTPEALDGDRILDLDRFDRVQVVGAAFGREAVTLADDALLIDADEDGDAGTRIALDRLPQGGEDALRVSTAGNVTTVAFGPLPGEPGPLALAEARTVALLYEAGLGRRADEAGLNFWIDQREAGASEEALAGFFLASMEFAERVGPPATLSDRALVEGLYENVLDREGEAEGVDFWTGLLGDGFGRDETLLAFADSEENRAMAEGLGSLSETEEGTWAFA